MKLDVFNLMYALDVCTNLIEGDREQYKAFTGRFYDIDRVVVECCQIGGRKWAITEDNRAVAVGGYSQQRTGVYHSWMLSRAEAWYPGTPITEIVKGVITGMYESGAHRLETVCLADRAEARRWYLQIGLRYETTLVSYGVNREPAVCYVGTGGHK